MDTSRRNKKRKITKEKKGENAMNVICNKDLFLHIQEFTNGIEKIVVDFSTKFNPKHTRSKLLEAALNEGNFNIADKIYKNSLQQSNNDNNNDNNISLIWPHFESQYPHPAYSLVSTCEWLHTRVGDKYDYWKEYMDVAAGLGDLNLVIFMHKHRHEGCSTKAMDNAASSGHLEIVKYLHENRTEGCTTIAMDYAARDGHLEIVKYLHENRTEGCTTDAMDYAARNGHLEIVKFLHENCKEGCATHTTRLE
jgi:hypothetical protein